MPAFCGRHGGILFLWSFDIKATIAEMAQEWTALSVARFIVYAK